MGPLILIMAMCGTLESYQMDEFHYFGDWYILKTRPKERDLSGVDQGW